VDLKQSVFCHYDKAEMNAHIIRVSGGFARHVWGGLARHFWGGLAWRGFGGDGPI